MREFSKVSPAVWQSKRFCGLPNLESKHLYLYYLTSQHQNSAGAYKIRDGYACDDLGWKVEQYRKAREELVAADLVHFDKADSVVLITRWFKHNPPMNESHLTGIERILERLPSSELASEASDAALEAWEAVHAARTDARAGNRPSLEYLACPRRCKS